MQQPQCFNLVLAFEPIDPFLPILPVLSMWGISVAMVFGSQDHIDFIGII
jgi:hypothetical protein